MVEHAEAGIFDEHSWHFWHYRLGLADPGKPQWRTFPSGLLVLHWEKRIGGAIGLWPISERTAPRLTNGQMKEADLTGEMMRRFREAPTRYWYVSGIVLRPELGGTRAIRVLLGDGSPLDLHRRDHIPFPTSSSRVFERR